MFKKRLNTSAETTNTFKVSDDFACVTVPKYKGTVTIVTSLTAMIFPDADGVTQTIAFAPAPTTAIGIRSALEAKLVEHGYILDNYLEGGAAVTVTGTFVITFIGSAKITSVNGVAVTSVAI